MRALITTTVLMSSLVVPASARAEPIAPVTAVAHPAARTMLPMDGHPLYFAVELRRDGQVVGRPKLLGAEGKRVAMEKRTPGEKGFDYRLVLFPHARQGDRYELTLDVALPGMSYHYDLELLHGEIRKIGERPAAGQAKNDGKGFEVELLVLKVDSPEFRALMNLTGEPAAQPSI